MESQAGSKNMEKSRFTHNKTDLHFNPRDDLEVIRINPTNNK